VCPAPGSSSLSLRSSPSPLGGQPFQTALPPPCDSIADRKISSWTNNDADIASASAAHKRVDPSTSVNRNVTVPDGRTAGPASCLQQSRMYPRGKAQLHGAHRGGRMGAISSVTARNGPHGATSSAKGVHMKLIEALDNHDDYSSAEPLQYGSSAVGRERLNTHRLVLADDVEIAASTVGVDDEFITTSSRAGRGNRAPHCGMRRAMPVRRG
jgi:hypothetical protein